MGVTHDILPPGGGAVSEWGGETTLASYRNKSWGSPRLPGSDGLKWTSSKRYQILYPYILNSNHKKIKLCYFSHIFLFSFPFSFTPPFRPPASPSHTTRLPFSSWLSNFLFITTGTQGIHASLDSWVLLVSGMSSALSMVSRGDKLLPQLSGVRRYITRQATKTWGWTGKILL